MSLVAALAATTSDCSVVMLACCACCEEAIAAIASELVAMLSRACRSCSFKLTLTLLTRESNALAVLAAASIWLERALLRLALCVETAATLACEANVVTDAAMVF